MFSRSVVLIQCIHYAPGDVHVLEEGGSIGVGHGAESGHVGEVVVDGHEVQGALDQRDLLISEGGQAGAHSVTHGLRVSSLEDGVQEPAVPEICIGREMRKIAKRIKNFIS